MINLDHKGLIEESDVEVDYLGSSEDESDEQNDDDDDCSVNHKDDHVSNEDELDYINFVNSVLANGEENNSTTERISDSDDDSEDYIPNSDIDIRNDDNDETDENEEFVRVNNHEVRELVGDCWQTIANNQNILEIRPQLPLPSPTTNTTFNTLQVSDIPKDINSNNIPMKESKSGLIHNFVKQLFSGRNLSDICVDGMPIDTIRKLVARQMSMAVQLIIQMLLLSDYNSECFNISYNKIMELNNFREGL